MVDASPLGAGTPPALSGGLRAWSRQNHFLICFAALASLMGVSVGMAQVTTSLFAAQLGASGSMLGLIAAGQSIGVILMSLPAGMLTERHGPRWPFVLGTAVAGAIYALAPLARAPVHLLAAIVAISFFMPLRFVPLNTLFLQQLSALGPSKAGWYRGTHMAGMFLLGPVLGAYVVAELGTPASYRLIALVFLATIAASPIVLARYSTSRSAQPSGGWRALRGQLALILKDRELSRISLVEGTAQATSAFFTFFIPILGARVAGMDERLASSLITAKGLSYICALFFLGGWLGRLGTARAHAIGFGLVAVGLSLVGGSRQHGWLWCGALLTGLGLGAVQLVTLTRYAQIGQRSGYGKVSGVSAVVGPTGSLLGGLLGGNAAHWLGLPGVFQLAGGAFLLASASLVLLPRLRAGAQPGAPDKEGSKVSVERLGIWLEQRYGASAARPAGLRAGLAAAEHGKPVLGQLLQHRSVRSYLPRAVPPGTVELLVAAAQSAASSSNLQLWSVIVVEDPARRRALYEVAGKQAHILECPLFLVWVADLHRPRQLARERGLPSEGLSYLEMSLMAAIDTALAAQNAVIAAESLGLGTVYIGALRNQPERVSEALELPAGSFAAFGLCVGWPDPERPAAIKPRLPQSVVVHHDRYRPEQALAGAPAYDQTMQRFYEAERMDVPGGSWTIHSAQRVANAAALRGRDVLRKTLTKLGVGLQ